MLLQGLSTPPSCFVVLHQLLIVSDQHLCPPRPVSIPSYIRGIRVTSWLQCVGFLIAMNHLHDHQHFRPSVSALVFSRSAFFFMLFVWCHQLFCPPRSDTCQTCLLGILVAGVSAAIAVLLRVWLSTPMCADESLHHHLQCHHRVLE